ncbi:cyclohexanone monooxygenase [Mycena floridula]|nr:cyclohexanone monooxygenase [Mycena floridula]
MGNKQSSGVHKEAVPHDPVVDDAAAEATVQEPVIADLPVLDCLIVGAGFAGLYLLHKLRSEGFTAKIFESQSNVGGIWQSSRYPGARVDSEVPVYEFSMPEVWKDWEWSEKFPGWKELQAYLSHAARILDLNRDIVFNTRVLSAHFDQSADRWSIEAAGRKTVVARHLLLCTGIGSAGYSPPFPGLETFKGSVYHTSKWEDVDVKGKRVGIIGTGASGVQVIQELAPDVAHMTVFQRTPNLALAMNQRKFKEGEIASMKKQLYPIVHRRRNQTGNGFHFDRSSKPFSDATPEERELLYRELWEQGSFRFLVSNFADLAINDEANRAAYEFWRDRVFERVHDPVVAEKLAPKVPFHPFGAKRPSLEQTYFEVFNQPNVVLVDLKTNPMRQVVANGVQMADGKVHEMDILILATGFDAVTGGITQIDIVGTEGESIKEKWSKGVYSYLGYMTHAFPNMFWTYGPHSPTAFCNGPTCIELQGNWIVSCLINMREKGFTRIQPTRAAEESWREFVNSFIDVTVSRHSWKPNGEPVEGIKSSTDTATGYWYMGSNIPGKPVESQNFLGGVQMYEEKARESAENGYQGFVMTSLET